MKDTCTQYNCRQLEVKTRQTNALIAIHSPNPTAAVNNNNHDNIHINGKINTTNKTSIR